MTESSVVLPPDGDPRSASMSQTELQHANPAQPVSAPRPNDDLLSSRVDDAGPVSAELEVKVATARQAMEAAVGYPLEIDRFEPIASGGEWTLRVFWRKAGSR